jgi:hypothetical protein
MHSGWARKQRRNESWTDRMSHDRSAWISRRATLAGFAAAGAGLIGHASADAAGPTFSASGPNAQTYGAAEGYPVPDPATARRQGNPWEPRDRVGAFTHIDAIYPTRLVKRAAAPWSYKWAPAALSDPLRDRVTGYLSRNPVPASWSLGTIRSCSSITNMGGPTATGSFRNRWSSRSPAC